MADMRFIPRDDAGKDTWLQNFARNLAKYVGRINVTAEIVAQTNADAAAFSFLVRARQSIDSYSRGLTARRDALREGGTLGPFPPLPDLGPEPGGAVAGIFPRVAKLAQRIKIADDYEPAIGTDLGIISARKTIGDLATVAPQLTVRLVGGRPVIGWNKGRMTGVEIHVDRLGRGDFEKLSEDFSPPYRDQTPLPPAGTAAIWTYKAMYIYRGKLTGQWSPAVQIVVAGS